MGAFIQNTINSFSRLVFPIAAFVGGAIFASGAAQGDAAGVVIGLIIGAAAVYADKVKA